MIPWRISISGIRDYRPEMLDISGGIDDHILVTGPNGSGKSTITYCMGAVLYSSKVDVEGLKSRNLLPNQTWKAQISLVFKNEGQMKIDAAQFVQFTLRIVQEPGQPIKKEYSVSTGEELDQWEDTTKYTSGDRQFNFTAYKQDVLYKYKVDPDAYYLIWYQQDVNQFATMNPEERFRIFSEMHGIDQIQQEWEESIEKLKETTETLRTAKYSVDNKKLELQIKKADLERYTNNQERLKSGAKQYIEAILMLERALKNDMKSLEGIIEQLSDDLEERKEAISLKEEEKIRLSEQVETLQNEKNQLEDDWKSCGELIEALDGDIQVKKQSIELLEKELEGLTNRKNQITRTEQEVKEELSRLAREIANTSKLLIDVEAQYEKADEMHNVLLGEIAELTYQVKEDARQYIDHSKILSEYKSSHGVSVTIDKLEADIITLKNEQGILSNNVEELKKEKASLQENRDLSKRQYESLTFLRKQNIKAYPLRELVELDEKAQLKDESLFNAIKYTIFFQGKWIDPPNDLYHVPLMEIVPDRSVEILADLHLKIKEDIKEEDIPHAIKALWWVGQFFKNNTIKILNGNLHDAMGIRGPQEKERYILSKKALLARKREVENLISNGESRLSYLTESIYNYTKKLQELNRIIQFVKEAEAFIATGYERESRIKQLEDKKYELSQIVTSIKELDETRKELSINLIQLKKDQVILKDEEKFYEELGKMKGKYDELQKLQQIFLKLKNEREQESKKQEILEISLNKLEGKIKKLKRDQDDIAEEIDASNRQQNRITTQQKNKIEEKDITARDLVFYIKEITELKELVPQIYGDVISLSLPEQLPSVTILKNQRENGKVTFENARTETDIDPAAPENYEAVKKEFERLENEHNRTNILLEQDRERAEQLKDKLETTINMRVTEIRRRFQSYMSHFQFEGEVDWESSEDKKGRVHYKLFIKARKEGHRGTMEDVSTKARGGRVGKGVSGGEESLSSLLFALALLQNLSFKPGFIVLDEFDSALDENRKLKVFDLYVQELKRKLIILTPKSHEEHYLKRFSKALVVQHDPTIPSSKIVGIVRKDS